MAGKSQPPTADQLQFLAGGGEMGAIMRSRDWSGSSLGHPATWPQALRTVVRLMLNSGHPMYIFWGADGACLYNDAYRQSIGPERHPGSLGQPARKVWDEIWDIIGPQIGQVMAGGEATWHENALVPITRHGKREDVYWTYSYSPIDVPDAANGVGGVMVVCTETTDAVMARQRGLAEQARQRRLFEQAPGFIVIMRGPDHQVEFVNDAHRQLFNSGEWVGRTMREAFPSISGQGFYELLDKVYTTGETFEASAAEVRFRTSPDAPEQTRYLTFIYAPLHDDGQNITGIFCEGFDVTEAQSANTYTRALADLGDRIRDIDDPDELAYAAAEILGKTLGVSRAGYGTIDVVNETISIKRDWNMPGVQTIAGLLRFRDYGSYIEDLKRGVTVAVADADKDLRTAATADALKAITAHAFVNMPVTEQGGFVALLYLNHASAREWSEGELGLMREVAERTRTAVERRRAESSLRASEERLRFLDTLSNDTARLIDADAILARTTELVGRYMGVSICAYADMDPDENHFTIRGDWAAAGSRSIVGRYSLEDFGKLAVTNLGAGLPLVLEDNRQELPQEESAAYQSLGITATICMPLVKDGRLTALMAIHNKDMRHWTEEELSLIREVTERSWAHIERVRSQSELRESELRYRALFNAMDEGFCVIEFFDGPHGPLSDYIHVEANPAYGKHSGIPNVVGQRLREMVGDEADDWVRRYGEVLRTGESIRFERELEATGRWLELSAFRIEPASRKQVAVLFQDLTDRKLAEIALAASEENFRTLTRAMPNQAWTARPDGYLDWFNEQVYAYSGAPEGALDGAEWTAHVHPEDLPLAIERWQHSLSTGETYESEFRLRRADGVYLWHLARAVPLASDDGSTVRWIGTNTDIQATKELSQRLAELASTLEQRVEERTSQLMVAEEALRQSQKMEAVGQLTGGIAHDFNNLLGGISGSLELLEKRLAEGRRDGLERYIASAKESSRRAASLTQRLLAFSRRQTLAPKAVDVNRLVSGMEDLIRRTAGPTITVEVVGAGGLWTTKIDPSQLENSLLNLCINARDAMAPNGGRLTIETANKWLDERAAQERDLAPGQYISLCVTDNGAGMTDEVIARAFDPFFTTKPLGEGTGLGLSMVYGFVRQSGGQVRIYSEVGTGTTMCLYLPRHHGDADVSDVEVAAGAMEHGAGETVLVIDDEPILRMLMTDVLAENGYGVLEAVDGPSGLAILVSDQRIDLLITDVGLPGGMNGRQVADAARKVRPDLKVLFITGYAENAVVGNGHLDPGMEVMTKPFVIANLASKIRDMIDR